MIKIDIKNKIKTNEGVFEGFGTSLCWWAHRIGYHSLLTEMATELFFGKDGLNFNVMRYNVGGGDDPTHNHIKRTDSKIPGWLKLDENGNPVYDYEADKNQLNVLKSAYKKAGKNTLLEIFSNSPPYFMTVSGCSCGSVDAVSTNIKKDCIDDFADYLVTVGKHLEDKHKLKVYCVSPMNEPDTDYWKYLSEKQEGCHIDKETQSDVIVATRKAMKKHGLNALLVASDETDTGKGLDEYNAYTKEARSVIDRINVHTYGVDRIEELGALREEKGFNLWMSETDGSGLDGEDAGQMACPIWFAKKIIFDINKLKPSAYVMWQVIDSHISIDGFDGNKDSGMPDIEKGYWGLAVCDHDQKEILLTQKYFVMGQFSKYLTKGMSLITVDDNALAGYDKQKNKMVIVAVNDKKRVKEETFALTGFSFNGKVKAVRTSGKLNEGESFEEVACAKKTGDGVTVKLKGNSVTTFILSGVKEL